MKQDAVKKELPGSSDVHVPVPLGGKKSKKKKNKAAPIKKSLDQMLAISAFDYSLDQPKTIPILKANSAKQIVYGVVLTPDEVDAQGDYMTAQDIEQTAHDYVMKSRTIGGEHLKSISAVPVESYIAPQDFEMAGQHGSQLVKKGAWILGVKIADPKEWAKVVAGIYTGFSVGGLGSRT